MEQQILDFLLGLTSGTVSVPLIMAVFTLGILPATNLWKNVAAFVLPFVLAGIGAAGLIYLGQMELPDPTVGAWAMFIFPLFTAAYTASQAVYKAIFKPAIAAGVKLLSNG